MVTEQGQLLRPCDMQNERVVTGPALGLKDFGHGLRIQPIGAQTVDCLSGNCHQPAPADELRRYGRGLGVPGVKKYGVHVVVFLNFDCFS